ncbi:hypothetical protein T4B_8447 [Trichinella pseudospiralis]|uniref:Uncharacterized protein n=1 Tax=Trichinella pseudospiralis TaxID=6337 RepID=A0A0V1IXB7_TRIPS|nr:hypothetical protein T4B_8447 [Trichinella pseudospiralis]
MTLPSIEIDLNFDNISKGAFVQWQFLLAAASMRVTDSVVVKAVYNIEQQNSLDVNIFNIA